MYIFNILNLNVNVLCASYLRGCKLLLPAIIKDCILSLCVFATK